MSACVVRRFYRAFSIKSSVFQPNYGHISRTVVTLHASSSYQKDVTKTGNGERGAGNGGTEVWERVVSGNLHKNTIWPMMDDREPSKQT